MQSYKAKPPRCKNRFIRSRIILRRHGVMCIVMLAAEKEERARLGGKREESDVAAKTDTCTYQTN
jgi:hypothetical protein